VPDIASDTLAALRSVGVATLTVPLRRRGFASTFIPGLRATRPDLRMVGVARTVRYLPTRADVAAAQSDTSVETNAQRRAFDTVGAGEVIVIEARGRIDAATLGDVLATRALMRGAAGVVTDGALRDTPAFAGVDLPVYHRASHGTVAGAVHVPLETDVPIACGEVLVLPGDVLVGDAEGVVVIPRALVDEVAAEALEAERRESWALERVRAGESIAGVFPLGAGHLAEYEAWRAGRP
jgi:regulator of RNase E activity RraA